MEKHQGLTEVVYHLNKEKTKDYLAGKVEILLTTVVGFLLFFQFFPYYYGMFSLAYYLPYLCFMAYFMCQVVGIEAFNYKKPLLLLYALFIFWLFYGGVSLVWSRNIEIWSLNVHFRFMAFCTFYTITQYLSSKKRFDYYAHIIVICVVWNLAVCAWEITTLQHLPTSSKYGILIYIPTSANYNENNLASMFVTCFPILFYLKGKYKVCLSSFLALLVGVVLLVQRSRLNFIISTPFFLHHFIFKTRKVYKLMVVLMIVFAVFYIVKKYPEMATMAKYHLDKKVLSSFGNEVQSQYLGSMRTRVELYKLCIEKLVQSYGFGVGMGNFEDTVSPYSTRGFALKNPNPHSLFFETIANEGIIGITLLCSILFMPLIALLRQRRQNSALDPLYQKKYADRDKQLFMFFIIFVVAVSVPSSIRNLTFFWNILAYHHALFYNYSITDNEISN